MIAKLVHYSGHVQGVGFRYTAQRIASGFVVHGYVRNLPGGDVELWAEGDAGEVERFLDALARQMAEHIAGKRVQEQTPRALTEFTIRP
ncbi:MAG: acylphosphatase [Gemmataceae bacterium]